MQDYTLQSVVFYLEMSVKHSDDQRQQFVMPMYSQEKQTAR